MIDYIIANLGHEPGCVRRAGTPGARYVPSACTCPRAEAIAWLERREAFDKASKRCAAHLVGAISLLESGGKEAAASDRMFRQMLADGRKALDEYRAAFARLEGEHEISNS